MERIPMDDDCVVGLAEELPEGARRIVKVGEEEIALFRLGGLFYALDNICPHRGGPLGEGDLQGHILHCPLHAWPFDVRTGVCPTNPNARVRIFRVRVENGELRISRSGSLTQVP